MRFIKNRGRMSGWQTTMTDAAGKWKRYKHDAFGNLVSVWEPGPAAGSEYQTGYKYDKLDRLTEVTMTRGATQRRTFVL